MTNETKHTPTHLIVSDSFILDQEGEILANTYFPGVNAHIVKCVNMHDELVGNFAELFKWLLKGGEEESTETIDRDSDMLERCRETLKKAGAL